MTEPRSLLSAALCGRAHPDVQSFGRFVAGETSGNVPPCWGDIVDAFDGALPTDEARVEAFEGLRASGDLGALILFLDHHRDLPNVLAQVWAVASELPVVVQCALVSLNDTPPECDVARLHPAARNLLADADARARDHEFYAARAAALRSFRTRMSGLPAHSAQTP